jgi:hypothetical protein
VCVIVALIAIEQKLAPALVESEAKSSDVSLVEDISEADEPDQKQFSITYAKCRPNILIYALGLRAPGGRRPSVSSDYDPEGKFNTSTFRIDGSGHFVWPADVEFVEQFSNGSRRSTVIGEPKLEIIIKLHMGVRFWVFDGQTDRYDFNSDEWLLQFSQGLAGYISSTSGGFGSIFSGTKTLPDKA